MKEDLIKSLNDLCNKLGSREFDYCNLKINEMTIFFCSRIRITNKRLIIDFDEKITDTSFWIKLENIEYLLVFAVTSATREIKEVINYLEGE